MKTIEKSTFRCYKTKWLRSTQAATQTEYRAGGSASCARRFAASLRASVRVQWSRTIPNSCTSPPRNKVCLGDDAQLCAPLGICLRAVGRHRSHDDFGLRLVLSIAHDNDGLSDAHGGHDPVCVDGRHVGITA